ncbi:hypothetical protein BU23DRAFT_545965 [Bimuria novae-zelandiae CBS 107.79]|uniref:N-acetyltransferase domain-containing protein n=1 Tax=Bimuria novae-zelandiae CBS 107.79 TaxID=1447943 RepID=A0A6A5UNI4_9PLEO|nr:hypothetical protein BU23DRAFT_545965 [Bimuria novae-zelandiae CBS 107.79]
MNAAWGYEEPTPVPPPQLKTKKRNGWPSPVRKGRHMWPKNRDMRPVTDDEGEWDVEHKSDSNGDPDYDVKKLIDWNGDWLPPPESWSARHTFTDRHFGASIEKWINGHHQSCVVNLTDLLAEADYLGHEEIAPRTWIPTRIEGDAPQLFWQALPSRAPPPLSDIDISEYRPFWEEYTQDSDFLNPLQHPAKSVLDMEDEENARPGAGRSLEQNLRNIAQKKTAHNRRRKQKQNRPIAMQELPPPSHPGYRPLANVYFRPVVPADATSIQELYNHYVRQSISVPEFKDRSLNEIVDRIHAITAEGLPYIVAVQKGPRQRGHQDYVNERIVGMAFMDDFCDKGSLYRFTFELEFYVHPDFLRQNIAKCLLDRLLEMVNTSYPAKGGYEWINHGEYLKYGSRRVVKAVLCNVPYPDKEDTKWIGEFMRKFGFHERGDLLKVGHKLGKVVNVLIYQHITSEDIDPSVPPFQPL